MTVLLNFRRAFLIAPATPQYLASLLVLVAGGLCIKDHIKQVDFGWLFPALEGCQHNSENGVWPSPWQYIANQYAHINLCIAGNLQSCSQKKIFTYILIVLMEGERAEVERIKPKDLTTMTPLKYAGTAEVRGFVLKQQYISLGVRLFLQRHTNS